MAGFALVLLWLQLAIPHERWLVVDRSGSIEAFDRAPELTPDQRGRALAVWVWSSRSAPRRIDPWKIGRTPIAPDGARLAVQVKRLAPARPPSDLRLIAAPVEMWIALPEEVLPSWPVPASGRLSLPLDSLRPVRLRVLGRGEGSWWTDVAAGETTALVTAVPAVDVDLHVLDALGKPAKPILGTLQGPRGQTVRPWAGIHAEDGRIEVAGLPDREEISLLIRHPSSGAPLFLVGRPGALPHEVRLPAAAALEGRLLDLDGKPLSGASIEAETWVSPELPMMHRLMTRTDNKGKWRLGGLPAGQVALTFRATRYVTEVDRLVVESGAKNLGDRRLGFGTVLKVQVVDDLGQPIPGAKVDAGNGRGQVTSDGRGVAVFADIPQAPVELRGAARRFLPAKLRLNPPFPAAPELRLQRAVALVGRIVDTAGKPRPFGSISVLAAGCSNESSVGADGGFELDLPPDMAGELAFRSPETRELRVAIAPGTPGEVRDLGDLAVSTGRVVTGRVIRAADGSAVAGARIWTTRQGADGPDIAWATGDLLAATSGEDGRFALRGLLEGTLALRAEAPGFARSQVVLTLDAPGEAGTPDFDLGIVTLSAGATVRVHVDPTKVGPLGAVARVDLGNRWLDADLLTAQVRDGSALISDVPSGKATVSVLAGSHLLCERGVTIPEGATEQEVDCLRPALAVSGAVTIGGIAADGGALTWRTLEEGSQAGMIQNLISPGGLRQQQVAGLGRPAVDVDVLPDGRFETDQLTPGAWWVSWRPTGGSLSGSIRVEIPPGERFETLLPFAGLAVEGTVTDSEGRPVQEARVRELLSGAFAISGPDGGFVLAGLRAGKAQVLARLRDQVSDLREVRIAADEPAEPIRLTLGDDEVPAITIRVVDPSGAPVAGAFVFLEQEGKGLQLLTAATDGSARSVVEAPLPERVRAAAFAGGVWGLGPWVTRSDAREGLLVALDGSGSLSIRTDRLSGQPAVAHAGGWDLSWLLRQLGVPPELSSERPLRIGGLPQGRYDVALGSARISIDVTEGRVGEGRLD